MKSDLSYSIEQKRGIEPKYNKQHPLETFYNPIAHYNMTSVSVSIIKLLMTMQKKKKKLGIVFQIIDHLIHPRAVTIEHFDEKHIPNIQPLSGSTMFLIKYVITNLNVYTVYTFKMNETKLFNVLFFFFWIKYPLDSSPTFKYVFKTCCSSMHVELTFQTDTKFLLLK